MNRIARDRLCDEVNSKAAFSICAHWSLAVESFAKCSHFMDLEQKDSIRGDRSVNLTEVFIVRRLRCAM